MLNRIVLIGRLTKDPELRYTPANGVAVATFTLAVNRRFSQQGQQREADFIPIVVWRTQAENCAKYLGKGSLVAVEGRLQIRSFEDREGQRRTMAEVVADSVQFLDSKEKRSNQEPPAFDDSMIGEDDVPF
ncbi:MAG: single-stranded DNA-binding protein [Bacillota bacterium]|nr:single-stranded DNA-binding protein [Bacillota bacterium]MDW7685358.1 single-stranded DNA-binding protein [Bacillota bacterium]